MLIKHPLVGIPTTKIGGRWMEDIFLSSILKMLIYKAISKEWWKMEGKFLINHIDI